MVKMPTASCYYCGVNENVLFRCIRCKKALYCSHSHQKRDWKQHRISCNKTSDNEITQSCKLYCKSHTFYPYAKPSQSNKNFKAQNGDRIYLNQCESIFSLKLHVLSKYVIENLRYKGYCVIDNFLGEIKAEKVLYDIESILQSGVMKEGQIAGSAKKQNIIRGDKITWITEQEEQFPNTKLIINAVDRLVAYMRNGLYEYTICGRTPVMVAYYPGDGSGYKKHIDNTQKDGRCVTVTYYLNKNWNSKLDGGQMKLYPFASEKYVEIEPIIDRILIFWSDKRTPHEVLPAYSGRFAMTFWYLDAVERSTVKDAY